MLRVGGIEIEVGLTIEFQVRVAKPDVVGQLIELLLGGLAHLMIVATEHDVGVFEVLQCFVVPATFKEATAPIEIIAHVGPLAAADKETIALQRFSFL